MTGKMLYEDKILLKENMAGTKAKKLAIIFPGVGYTCIKPLLYYTASLAADYRYEIKKLDYGEDIHTFKGRTVEELEPLIDKAVQRVLPELKELPWKEYDKILMISKSIGTTVACRVQQELGWQARHFLMTPIPTTLPYLADTEGCFLAGTDDPFISKELIGEVAAKYPDKVGAIFEGCNHSLEKRGETVANVKNLLTVLECLERML